MKQDKLEAMFPGEPLENRCPAVGYQRVAVCAAVTVTPFARLGAVTTVSCGEPESGSCCFTIRQELCVEVPVICGAEVALSDPSSTCISASGEDCTDCDCGCAAQEEPFRES